MSRNTSSIDSAYAERLASKTKAISRRFEPAITSRLIAERAMAAMLAAKESNATHFQKFEASDWHHNAIAIEASSSQGLNAKASIAWFVHDDFTDNPLGRIGNARFHLMAAIMGQERMVEHCARILCFRLAEKEADLLRKKGLSLPARAASLSERREIEATITPAPSSSSRTHSL